MTENASDPITIALGEHLLSMAHQLTDLTRRNLALFYPENRTLGLDLAKGELEQVENLLLGGQISIAEIFPKRGTQLLLNDSLDHEIDDSREGDPTALRVAKTQYRFAKSAFEEKGVATYFFASFAVEWTHEGKLYRAPLFVTPASLEPLGARGGYSASVNVVEGTRVNQSLETFMNVMFKLDLAEELQGGASSREGGYISIDFASRQTAADQLLQIIGEVVEVKFIQDFQVLDNFNFAKLPIIADLRSSDFLQLARTNPTILAMLGLDGTLLAEQAPTAVSVESLDREHPGVLPLIADANASQLVAIKTVMAGNHLVIQGPPGTGKSQTIANLIGVLSAEGKRVMFVAEKQAAILAVLEILETHGLGHLVLPLHGEGSDADARARILKNLERASSIRPVTVDLEGIAQVHETLRERKDLLDEVIAPSENSVLELIGFWSAVPEELGGDEVLDGSLGPWLSAVPDGFREVKDLARHMAVSGYLDAAVTRSAWADITIPETLSNGDLESLLKASRLSALPALGRSHLQSLLEMPIARASELIKPIVAFAAAEVLINEQLSDDQVFNYGRAYNLGPIAGSTFRFEGSLTERIKFRREFKRLLTSGSGRARDVVRGLVAARLALASEGLAHPPRQELEHIIEAGAWLTEVASMASALLADSSLSVERVAQIADECLRDLDAVPRVREWSKIRKILTTFAMSDRIINTFGSGRSQRDAQNLLIGILAGRLVRNHLRSGSKLGIIEPKEVAREFVLEDQKVFGLGAQRVANASASWTKARRDANPEQDRALREVLAKRRGGSSIRRLFHEIPDAVLAINPCIALSPVQVSSYLPKSELFDVIIFDEASQITPIEAIPSIARGSRVVVAGDKHQLPPSDFFDTQATVDDLEITETESVLKTLEVHFPSEWLNVHYRSNDNRLIAVSAEHVYWALSNLRLLTVPSAVQREDCIRFIEVESDPVSMKGTRTSGDDEIAAVVQEVFAHADRHPERSLGVITLSREHCDRIEAAIDRARKSRRDLDPFFSREGKQKFFVKNIERVQGDERDAIIISTGYQRNAAGQLPQNFGPIGKRDGGYRRVNVMISRAKMSMTLVSAFNAGDIRVQNAGYGVQLLHTFFRFMETGGQVLANAERTEEPMNPFELAIYDEIRARGIDVIPQLGVSGYWIDFALIHPEKPGVYVLAVEADGATYHSMPTARERDRLRQEHLEAKGFIFHRVWSTDWFRNRRNEVDRIVEAFENAVRVFDPETPHVVAPSTIQPVQTDRQEGNLPPVPSGVAGRPIDQIPDNVLDEVMGWARKLNPHRSEPDVIEIAFQALGFSRHGSRIMDRLAASSERTRPIDRQTR